MTIIRFPNSESEREAIAYLAGRFAFKTWSSGEMVVGEEALGCLATAGIAFTAAGRATYEQQIPADARSARG